MMTKEQYIEFLMSIPVTYTCTHLADHLSGMSHDSITDFLNSHRVTVLGMKAMIKTAILPRPFFVALAQ